jgi:hypothetical protein
MLRRRKSRSTSNGMEACLSYCGIVSRFSTRPFPTRPDANLRGLAFSSPCTRNLYRYSGQSRRSDKLIACVETEEETDNQAIPTEDKLCPLSAFLTSYYPSFPHSMSSQSLANVKPRCTGCADIFSVLSFQVNRQSSTVPRR